ncbi:peptide-methionine (S)-S-oxide reductase MsrA [Paenibacillus agricola]|nr:peptide-methionine (S)-S-oxide reductase MsrA [Paenibacillus agricola]
MAHIQGELATFAGGCFWSTESSFEKVPGVISVISGFTGGHLDNPTYNDVITETTGHLESVEVRYDPSVISYDEILQFYWRTINPTDAGGQFYDRGESYTTAIFVHNEEQRQIAEASKKAVEASGKFTKPIVTPIKTASTFYKAEEYHQDYYLKNPDHYDGYRKASGRDAYFEQTWGADREVKLTPKEEPYKNVNKAEKLKALTPLQLDVTQHEGTESPYHNEYWDSKLEGIYVDIVSGEPLFSSKDKYDSGTGWPSFTQPLEPGNIITKEDRSLGGLRVEVRSKYADSHLGHLFDDGPRPTGLRYCMNSASMEFIDKADLEKRGYGKYAKLFAS